ncbi:MAG TPA: hypothetical protein VGG72_10815 [Bryobacteraceae bacterium]
MRPACSETNRSEIDTGTLCRQASETPTSVGYPPAPPNAAVSGTGYRIALDAPKQNGAAAKKKDIPLSDGRLIVAEAATWKGTPYKENGPKSEKGVAGDCSGTTQKIYTVATCPYEYQSSHTFPEYALKSGLFRELQAGERKQDGDILLWPGHMAIYCSFATDPNNAKTPRLNKNNEKWTQVNDMWTASNPKPHSPPYFASRMEYWFDGARPRVFRYLK